MDMIRHLGPGSSYHLMIDWLREMGNYKVAVPTGFITVGFDNEQRLLKNWLARGSNRSSVEVLTNIVCAVHDKEIKAQKDSSLHRRSWENPSADYLVAVFDAVKDPLDSSLVKPLFFEYW